MFDTRNVADLEHRLRALARSLSQSNWRYLVLLGEFDAIEGWRASGALDCRQWLMAQCGTSAKTAYEQVRVARALRSLPILTASFAAGDLSYSKVRALTRLSAVQTEEELLELGARESVSQLESLARRARTEAARVDPALRHRSRSVHYYYDDDGMMVLIGRFEPEEGLGLVTTLDSAASGHLSTDSPAGESVEDRSNDDDRYELPSRLAQARADALVRLATEGNSAPEDARRPLVVVHVRAKDLEKPARLESGPKIAASTMRMLGCDGRVIAAVDHACGTTHNVGRSRRLVPRTMRRRLTQRDRGCVFPGCSSKIVDAHHISHWLDGGETSLENLALLCRRHHRAIHLSGFRMSRTSGRMYFTRPDGTPVSPPPVPTKDSVAS